MIRNLLVSLGTILVLGVIFGVAEWAFRIVDPMSPAERDEANTIDYHLWAHGPCYRVQRERGELRLVRVLPPGEFITHRPGQPLSFPSQKTPDVRRIVVLGESTANMLEQELEEVNRERRCDHRYEIFQCAVRGGNLPELKARFDHALDYDPDVIFIVFGHNLYFENPADNPVRAWLQRLRLQSRLLSHVARAMSLRQQRTESTDKLEELHDALQLFNLKAQRRHVTLAYSAMASNLWFPPASRPDEIDDPLLIEARFLRDTGQPDAALRVLTELIAKRETALYRFELGEVLHERGDQDGARMQLQRALDLDPTHLRSSSQINDAIRAAAHTGGFALRDSEADFERHAPDGIPGWESFLDNCHPRALVARYEAIRMFELVAGADRCSATASAQTSMPTETMQDWAALWMRTLPPVEDTLRALMEQATVVQGANFSIWTPVLPYAIVSALRVHGREGEAAVDRLVNDTRPMPAAARLALYLSSAEALWQSGRREKARALNERARNETSSDDAWVQLGRFELRAGAPEQAKQAYAHALAIKTDRPDAKYAFTRLSAAATSVSQ